MLKAEARTNFFVQPAAFFARWTGETQFLKNEKVTVWEPSCPDNYKALGELVTTNRATEDGGSEPVEPKKSDISCVHKDYLTTNYKEGQDLKLRVRKLIIFSQLKPFGNPIYYRFYYRFIDSFQLKINFNCFVRETVRKKFEPFKAFKSE